MRYWIETLGCPKNHVDSDKLAGLLESQGYTVSSSPDLADLVVANTCAFIEAAREESIETVLALADVKRAERATRRHRLHGRALRQRTRGRVARGRPRRRIRREPDGDDPVDAGRAAHSATPVLRPLEPAATEVATPWAYVKIAEGCDRRCGFCAIPSFRGDQRSRSTDEILAEGRALAEGGVRELVLIAQDLASWGHDRRRAGRGEAVEVLDEGGTQPLIELTRTLSREVDRVRLLYLYPSGLTERTHRRDPRQRRAVLRPVVAARVATAAARDEALGRRRPIPGAHRRDSRE